MVSAHFGTATYVLVFLVLIALTVATISASFFPLSGAWHVTIGLSIGFAKASLVALFFMHLIGSPRLTWSIVAIAFFWLAVLVVLTFIDYATRGLMPGMPGH